MRDFSPGSREPSLQLAERCVRRACAHLARSQQEDGGWRVLPLPRLLENALACLVADAFVPELRCHVPPARHWVRGATVSRHHEVSWHVETWLQAWVGGTRPGPPLDVSSALFREPVFTSRQVFFLALAFAVGAPVRGGPSREALQAGMLERVRARQTARLKRWSGAELAALFLLLAGPRPTGDTQLALDTLREAQSPSGSFGEHSLATFVGLAALRRWAPDSEAFARALAFVLETRTERGLWCFSHTDVWDTALLCRTLVDSDARASGMFERAASFLVRAQNTDGGWPYRQGVESDTDTTAMAMLALARSDSAREAVVAGRGFLERMRMPSGLWRTWQTREDPPAEDVVAHALLAWRASGGDEASRAPALEWLAERARREGGCRAHWFDIHAYAAHEVALALGVEHEVSRALAHALLAMQRPDGGWSPTTTGTDSTEAATGMALALLTYPLPGEYPALARAVHFLAERQDAQGAWTGALRMFVPRPFLCDFPLQTHALALHGLVAVLQRARR